LGEYAGAFFVARNQTKGREPMMNNATARVLTVEDDPIVRADLRVVLEDAGFDVCADARDGVEAVEMARLHLPDVIVLDLGLPRLDGIAATRQILREREVPIVALTGRSRMDAAEALDAGAVSCLRKPFVVSELVETVTTTVSTSDDSGVRNARATSRAAIAEVCSLLGYPGEWADELERRAYRSGRLWRMS
jgi:CheY-like chemotaxis protein